MTFLRRCLFTAAVAALTAVPSFAQNTGRGSSKLLAPFAPVVSKVNASTVRILCNDKDAALGAIVSADGLILTKASELIGPVTVRLGDGSIMDAETVAIHKETDLALLKIDMRGLKPVTFDDSKQEPIGNWLAAAGTGTTPTAVGIVSVATRDLSGSDARPGVNMNRGFLGVQLAEKDDANGGAVIDAFASEGRNSPPSAAKKAGMKVGDVIIAVNGKTVQGREQLIALMQKYKPDEKIKVKIRRNDEEMELTVTLGKPEQSRSDFQNSMGGELSGRRTGFPAILQTDMVLEPKNCGGPIVDLDGKVLGLAIARAGRVETWVLPSETIRPVLADMKAGKFPAVEVKKIVLPVAPAPRVKQAFKPIEKH
jgi:serine protease Do